MSLVESVPSEVADTEPVEVKSAYTAALYLKDAVKMAWSWQSWYLYQEGWWRKVNKETLQSVITESLVKLSIQPSRRLIEDAMFHLKSMTLYDIQHHTKYTTLTDTSLFLKGDAVPVPHSPLHNTLTQRPWSWADMSKYPDSSTNLAIQWFESAYPDHAYVRYWLKSLLKGEGNPETYLEIAGAGATGKSTLARIAEYMVGSELTLTSTMKDLESRFELSGLRGKSLVLIPDAGKYDGDYSTLKAIVGGDKVRCEYKGIQGDFDFYPQCKVIIATNKALGGSDYSSGLRRRRVLVTPVKVKGFEDTLFKYIGGQYVGVLKDYIPSFMKYVLDADIAPVQPISQASHSLILEWALEALVAVAKSRVYIGILKGGTEGLMDVGEKLYPTFIVWCDSTGNRRIPLQDFTAALLDSLDYHGWDVVKGRDSAGVYVLGVQLIVQV